MHYLQSLLFVFVIDVRNCLHFRKKERASRPSLGEVEQQIETQANQYTNTISSSQHQIVWDPQATYINTAEVYQPESSGGYLYPISLHNTVVTGEAVLFDNNPAIIDEDDGGYEEIGKPTPDNGQQV